MKDSLFRITDDNNETIGYISTDFSGNKKVMDSNFKVRGYYNKMDNLTVDIYDNIVGLGDGSYYLLKFI